MADRLASYNAKRDFGRTDEPKGKSGRKRRSGLWFSVQKHAASSLHYDLRLEWGGVLLSWAVPKGPSPATGEKRLAMRTEDHPFDYGDFEGTIPKGEYGGGTVMLWDQGTWSPRVDPDEGLEKGSLKLDIAGKRMRGGWALVRFKRGGDNAWLLIKEKDDYADDDPDALTGGEAVSVKTGRRMDEIAAGAEPEKVAARKPAGAGKAVPERSRKAPAFVRPQLATLVDEARAGDDWIHETKFDGYRCLAGVGKGGVTLHTRSGKDWTEKFAALDGAFDPLPCDAALIDGEVMAARIRGSAFSSLQRALGEGGDLVFFAFDLLSLDGEDLTGLGQLDRRDRLERLMRGVPAAGPLRLSDHVVGHGAEVFAAACKAGAEGIISKRAGAPYRSARTKAWLKVKCTRRQEFVVGGYAPSDKDRPFASLLVGEHGPEGLRYRGRVGTGYAQADFEALGRAMRERRTRPFIDVPRAVARDAIWVTPEVVVEVEFTELTEDGQIRHGAYQGIREDKAAGDVTFESPAREAAMDDTVAGIAISSGDREVFPTSGCTKLDVARHYERLGERMVEIAGHRPLLLYRAPKGIDGHGFFQKHGSRGFPDALGTVAIEESDGGTEDYLCADSTEAFVAAAQMGTIEFHIWGARTDRLERPDRMVFDLDPDAGLGWDDTRSAAFDLRDRLGDLGLAAGALVTGGKGVHVWLPLRRSHDWATVKGFSKTFATVMADKEPKRFTATMSKSRRKGRIFIDWLRNERGATAIAPYSLRARRGAPVAMPVTWDELAELDRAGVHSMSDARERLEAPCPYLAHLGHHQRLTNEVIDRLDAWAAG